jgi:uncharacterized membrane protein
VGDIDSRPRRRYIDWARGIAVLLMIEAHTIDAWTRVSAKKGPAFRDATILGGFAAPLFLWLAGVAIVLAATRTAERTGSRARALEIGCRRGLEIFILAFLFRLQGLIVTPGGHPVTLFRVDVLNIMGPSMVVVALLWPVSRATVGRVSLYAAATMALALMTPIVRASPLVDALPVGLQWYVRPAGDLTIFTLFPWAGFVFAGAAVGALVAAAADERSERRLHATLAAIGLALVTLGFWTAGRPSIYRVSSFWTTSPAWFAIRVGILMMALSVVYTLVAINAASRGRAAHPLERLGRSSLFVYWIHVELVYGYASWLWRQRLPLWGTAIAYVAFCVLMYRAIGWRDRFVDSWRARRGLGRATETAPA